MSNPTHFRFDRPPHRGLAGHGGDQENAGDKRFSHRGPIKFIEAAAKGVWRHHPPWEWNEASSWGKIKFSIAIRFSGKNFQSTLCPWLKFFNRDLDSETGRQRRENFVSHGEMSDNCNIIMW